MRWNAVGDHWKCIWLNEKASFSGNYVNFDDIVAYPNEYGNADVLQVLDLPAVNAGEGEVRVRVSRRCHKPHGYSF